MPSKPLSVSLVIPSYNGKRLFQKHLASVLDACGGSQIVVVDDASTDDSADYLRDNFPTVEVLALPKNVRFAGACNAGVKKATGEIVILLNNDVHPQKDFLGPLISVFDDPKVAAAGCVEISTDQLLSGRAGGTFSKGMVVHWRARNQTKTDTFWVSGGSGAFRKLVWEELGGMDTLFAPAYEEDRDLCYRMLKRGYKVVFVPSSVVEHKHETTNVSVLGKRTMTIASYRNSLLFVWKNITDKKLWRQHLAWLPYHIIITGLLSRGLYWYGLWGAVKKLSLVRQRRQIEVKEADVSDEDIFARTRTIV